MRELARFVREWDDWVNEIVAAAQDELHRLTAFRHLSFASAVAEGTPASRRTAAEAVYLHLKQDHHLVYEWGRAFDEATGAQQLRTPEVIRREGRGACVDLTNLYLSCLANAKLEPVSVRGLDEDHVLAGFWLARPSELRPTLLTPADLRRHLREDRLLAVECTGFAKEVPGRQYKLFFEEACAEARKTLLGPPEAKVAVAWTCGGGRRTTSP